MGDPGLAAESVDLIFTSNTYHHIEERAAYFARTREALRPAGRIAIVEYHPEGWFYSTHGTAKEVIVSEMEQAGFRLVSDHDFLEKQSFVVFSPSEPSPASPGENAQ